MNRYDHVTAWNDVVAGNTSLYELVKLKADENNRTTENETDAIELEQLTSPLDCFSVKVLLIVLYTLVFVVCFIGNIINDFLLFYIVMSCASGSTYLLTLRALRN